MKMKEEWCQKLLFRNLQYSVRFYRPRTSTEYKYKYKSYCPCPVHRTAGTDQYSYKKYLMMTVEPTKHRTRRRQARDTGGLHQHSTSKDILLRLHLSVVTAFFWDTTNKFRRHLTIVNVRTWFQFWVPSLSHSCAPYFSVFRDKHSGMQHCIHKILQYYCCQYLCFLIRLSGTVVPEYCVQV